VDRRGRRFGRAVVDALQVVTGLRAGRFDGAAASGSAGVVGSERGSAGDGCRCGIGCGHCLWWNACGRQLRCVNLRVTGCRVLRGSSDRHAGKIRPNVARGVFWQAAVLDGCTPHMVPDHESLTEAPSRPSLGVTRWRPPNHRGFTAQHRSRHRSATLASFIADLSATLCGKRWR
jgi:hypothetical protein